MIDGRKFHADRAVPSDDGFRFDNQEDIGPARPKAAESGSKHPVTGAQGRPWVLPFEDGDLLAESQDFECGLGASPEARAEGNHEREKKLEHVNSRL